MGATKTRTVKTKNLIPGNTKTSRGLAPARAGFRIDRSTKLKNGGCKNK